MKRIKKFFMTIEHRFLFYVNMETATVNNLTKGFLA